MENQNSYVINYKDGYFYNKRFRKKRNGKFRVIHAPSQKLKILQKEFAEWFYNNYAKEAFKNNDYITGFLPNKSISDNAKKHLDKDWVINIDIENFFPSVNTVLGADLFDQMPKSKNPLHWFSKNKPLAFKGLDKTTFLNLMFLKDERNDGLPQGSPASPLIANYIAMNYIDSEALGAIDSCISDHGIEDVDYTRYADDLTISFNKKYVDNIVGRKIARDVTAEVSRYIESGPFKVKKQKVKIKHKSQRQSVTGVVVNGQDTRINKNIMNNMRAAIHNSKRQNKELSPQINGMLSHIQSVNKDQYQKLIKQLGEKNESNRG